MPSLRKDLRDKLETTVLAARVAAEAGAREALTALGVDQGKAFEHLKPAEKASRNQLRARGRQAGDLLDDRSGKQTIEHLVQVVAYEHWHRMLFARFLAENGLLLEPDNQVAVSLADVDELARDAKVDIWELAGRFAQRMLPAVFRADLPAPRPKSGAFCVYVHRCSDNSFSIGQTDDFQRRLTEHEQGKVSWTAPRLPIKPIHWEVFPSREEAVAREQELKAGFGRQWLKREYEKGRLAAAARQAGDPVLALTLARETRTKLEKMVADLPKEVFLADDSLGWTYQFWQAQRKEEVNKSGVKIGADELSPVTQLFTEDYMVEFLLHNTIGAWWAGKQLRIADRGLRIETEEDARRAVALPPKKGLPGVDWKYLRFIQRSTGVPPVNSESHGQDARAPLSATLDAPFFDPHLEIDIHDRNLPHWQQDEAWIFVTWRLADSLPAEKRRQWQVEKELWLRQHPEPWDDTTVHEFHERFTARIEAWLDAGEGSCVLRDPGIRRIVTDALAHFDGERYELGDYVVMPNHAHVLFRPKSGHALADILHSWKSFTAKKINQALGRTGQLWQEEYWDRLIRHERHLAACQRYIAANPAKAHLSPAEFTHRRTGVPPGVPPVNSDQRSIGVPPVSSEKHGRDARAPFVPAAGTFDGWPKTAKAITFLDPCMGSGHFTVFALPILARLRMEEENLDAAAAVTAVLRDNIHGLELDERCTQIAAFNLALAAWKLGGHQPLPSLHLACSGLSVGAEKDAWLKLADRAALIPKGAGASSPRKENAGTSSHPPSVDSDNLRQHLRFGMDQLYELFRQAPALGSLINPRRLEGEGFLSRWDELRPMVEEALAAENGDLDASELAVTAKGLAKAAEILAGQFTLVATNVPYLTRGKQDDTLLEYSERVHPDAKADLATCFVERCLSFCISGGSAALVTPQNWFFLGTYTRLRENLLGQASWSCVARLGPRAFETIGGEVVNVALVSITHQKPADNQYFVGVIATEEKTPDEKNLALRTKPLERVKQDSQLQNPDSRITLEEGGRRLLLSAISHGVHGLGSKDTPCFFRQFWEVATLGTDWEFLQTTVNTTQFYGGMEQIVFWEQGKGLLHERGQRGEAILVGGMAWKKKGIIVSQMNKLCASLYLGDIFDKNAAVVLPSDEKHIPAIWAFCSSPLYNEEVRKIDQKVNVTNVTLVKVPFDLAHWQKVATEKYPHGLPKPFSSDPTQWLFNGHPNPRHDSDEMPQRSGGVPPPSSQSPGRDAPAPFALHVAVARLLGYQWPRQTGSSFPDCPALGPDGLESHADADGIVCLSAVRGERTATDRLRTLLAAAFQRSGGVPPPTEMPPGRDAPAPLGIPFDEHALITTTGSRASTLEDWLRDDFFAQHCGLFHSRPFIWHIWDGRSDGFHTLVNCHKLAAPAGAGRKLLELLTFAYLGDWIKKQRDEQKKPGAEDRLIAAEALQRQLEAILAGEPPYDIFVRWKPLHQQPIGWEPDLNDGVRLNIRPFLMAKDVARKGAGILRFKPSIKWDKDRGKEPARAKSDFPWFWGWDEATPNFAGGPDFDGNRWNDCHYTPATKRAARERQKRGN